MRGLERKTIMYKSKTPEEIMKEHENRVAGAKKAYETKQRELRLEQYEALRGICQTTIKQINEAYEEYKSMDNWD